MSDPVDDFARGPEVKGVPVQRWTFAEILDVLRPFAVKQPLPFLPDNGQSIVYLGSLRRARDLYLKLGGML